MHANETSNHVINNDFELSPGDKKSYTLIS